MGSQSEDENQDSNRKSCGKTGQVIREDPPAATLPCNARTYPPRIAATGGASTNSTQACRKAAERQQTLATAHTR
jgi:hypothetical protein